MISDSSADEYLTGVLEFPNWKETLNNDKLGFLREIVRRTTFFTYFQNISLSSKVAEERRTPTLDEIVDAGLSGAGGVCVNQNVFVTLLLRQIGFKADLISGKFSSAKHDNHAICVINFSEEGKYLLDLACALPFEEPVPLHKLPYSAVAAGFRYEYRYCSETKTYGRWQLDGTFFKGKFDDPKKELLRYNFSLEPRDYPYFQNSEGLVEIFTDPANSMFLQVPFLFRCIGPNPNEQDGSSDDREYVLIWGSSVAVYSKLTRHAEEYSTYDELIPHVHKYFPLVKDFHLRESIRNFNLSRVVQGSVCER